MLLAQVYIFLFFCFFFQCILIKVYCSSIILMIYEDNIYIGTSLFDSICRKTPSNELIFTFTGMFSRHDPKKFAPKLVSALLMELMV